MKKILCAALLLIPTLIQAEIIRINVTAQVTELRDAKGTFDNVGDFDNFELGLNVGDEISATLLIQLNDFYSRTSDAGGFAQSEPTMYWLESQSGASFDDYEAGVTLGNKSFNSADSSLYNGFPGYSLTTLMNNMHFCDLCEPKSDTVWFSSSVISPDYKNIFNSVSMFDSMPFCKSHAKNYIDLDWEIFLEVDCTPDNEKASVELYENKLLDYKKGELGYIKTAYRESNGEIITTLSYFKEKKGS
jgi:hypothetical protein